ncbi:MAG: CoA pyrophosphatase [Pseudomonadota bacterium]
MSFLAKPQDTSALPATFCRDLLHTLLLPAHPLLPPTTSSHAAVLVCCINASEPYVLLTRRSINLALHAGQISLPGGRIETKDESLEATALRETFEEIGLDPFVLQTLGRLPETRVSSGITITPVVAWCEREPELSHNPAEVAEIIQLPLHLALDASQYGTDTLERDGEIREFRFIRYGDHYIWGATARILLSLSELTNPVCADSHCETRS